MTNLMFAESEVILHTHKEKITFLYKTFSETGPIERNVRIKDLEEFIHQGDASLWLCFAMMTSRFPSIDEMNRLLDLRAMGDARETIKFAMRKRNLAHKLGFSSGSIKVITRGIVIDVSHTSKTALATGIQKVVRETVRSWIHKGRNLHLAVWTKDESRLIDLSREQYLNVTGRYPDFETERKVSLVIPWKSEYVLPELSIEPDRNSRLLALARHSGNTFLAVGLDCIPITTVETVAPGMGAAFASYLSILAHAKIVSPISQAAADEFSGWVKMLPSKGLSGPSIKPVNLPESPPEKGKIDHSFDYLDSRPLVLCVGSHEPRKNHLNVLYASELLWSQGADFALVFIGGNSWQSEKFDEKFDSLFAKNRPLHLLSKASDAELRFLYEKSTFTIFPSLNEGFGLPITESLSLGTPVITSNFGSMKEIAESGGCLTVDPKDIVDISSAMFSLLENKRLLKSLQSQCNEREKRTWDTYSSELWDALELS